MIGMRSLIVAAVLVASVAQALPDFNDDSTIAETCKKLAGSLPEDELMDSQDARALVGKWLTSGRQAYVRLDAFPILEHWDAMLKGKCPASIRPLAVMSWCKSTFPEAIIAEPLKPFAKKCLNVELVEEIVKRMDTRMHYKVGKDLIDAQFIDDFRKSNPEAGPLNFNTKTLDGSKAVGAIAEAFKRNFAETGRDLKALIESDNLKAYIHVKLTNECIKNVEAGIDYAKEIEAVGEFWEGGVEALIATLKPEAQAVIFRYGFCANIYQKSVRLGRALESEVLAQLQ